MKNPQTRGHRERGSRIRIKEEEGAQALGEKGFLYPLTQPQLKGMLLEKAAGSVTLNLRLQFLWASGRGSNDKLINNFPFSLLALSISCAAEILCTFFSFSSSHVQQHRNCTWGGNLRRWSRAGWRWELGGDEPIPKMLGWVEREPGVIPD